MSRAGLRSDGPAIVSPGSALRLRIVAAPRPDWVVSVSSAATGLLHPILPDAPPDEVSWRRLMMAYIAI